MRYDRATEIFHSGTNAMYLDMTDKSCQCPIIFIFILLVLLVEEPSSRLVAQHYSKGNVFLSFVPHIASVLYVKVL